MKYEAAFCLCTEPQRDLLQENKPYRIGMKNALSDTA